MMNFSRPPIYRSARAVPSSPGRRTASSGISIVRAIQILLAVTAFAIATTTLVHLYPMFHAVDSGMRAHIENGPTATTVLAGGGGSSASSSASGEMQQPGGGAEMMHHGVHKNMVEHRQSLVEHIKREREKRQQKMTKSEAQESNDGGDSANKLDAQLSKLEKRHLLHDTQSNNQAGSIQSSIETNQIKGPQINEPAEMMKPAKAKESEETLVKGVDEPPANPPEVASKENSSNAAKAKDAGNPRKSPDGQLPREEKKLARGYSGLPMDKTPALMGGKRGTVECDVDVNAMAYWNSPQGKRDEDFVSPFRVTAPPGKTKYLTFEPDAGGFNNIRMSLENIFVIAAASGRTLVLPPPQTMYLLSDYRKFDEFFPIFTESLQKRVKVITSKEFLTTETAKGGYLELDDEAMRQKLLQTSEGCDHMRVNSKTCYVIYEFVQKRAYTAKVKDSKNCLVFDENAFKRGPSAVTNPRTQKNIAKFCGEARTPLYYGSHSNMTDPNILHFHTSDTGDYRMLNHFYATIYFTDPVVDNYYKRFVRDFLHYHEAVFCAAGKIVRLLQEEGKQRGFEVDEEGAGGYSALHVRRGDLQYKEVIISAEEWYENTAKLWRPKEILYIATDEKDKSFFDPIAQHHDLRFLGDYFERAGLDKIDSNLMGMVEIVVASRGRLFVGTWHSTFSGYIMRLRGYYGMSKMSDYYSYRPRRLIMHRYAYPSGNYAAREFQNAWLGIDGDEAILKDLEPTVTSPIGPAANISLIGEPLLIPNHLARGVTRNSLPMSETPALVGASRGKINCDVNVDLLAYWNDPQGSRDRDFVSPFAQKTSLENRQYITFWQDAGRFNNIRMSFEIVMVFAAATGRTVVLPPTQNLHLEEDHSSIDSLEHFYSFQSDEFRKRVKVISMKEFLEKEGTQNGLAPLEDKDYARVLQLASFCQNRRKSDIYCGEIFEKIGAHSKTKVAPLGTSSALDTCLIFDEDWFKTGEGKISQEMTDFCGHRKIVVYTQDLANPDIIHFDTFEKEHRLLSHFYAFIYFSNPLIGNYYKRFVRDFLHYNDRIFCAAGKIVRSIQQEAMDRGFSLDEEGGGGYSSLHVRRNDLQYAEALISDDRWWDHTREIWKPKELLYIATDEKDRLFFDNFISGGHDLRFLDDYWEMAELGSFAKEHLGMMDAIIASRGRAFAGTYYSSFSGYINRLRGYYGMSKYTSWYSWNPVKVEMQTGAFFSPANEFKREYAIGWVGIDGDKRVLKDNEEVEGVYGRITVNTNDVVAKAAGINGQKAVIAGKAISEHSHTNNEVPEHAKTDKKEGLGVRQDQNSTPVLKNKTTEKVASDASANEVPAHGIRSLEESMINVLGYLPQEDKELEKAHDGAVYYIVFSTDCGSFQHWQSYLLFFSALRIKQTGFITRIASGCTDAQKQEANDWHQEHIAVMSSRFRIFFTPKFSAVKDGDGNTSGKDYKYFNKPFGVKHYLENSSDFGWDEKAGKMTAVKDNAVVMIIDPDMILLRPLSTDFSDGSVKFWSPFHEPIERKLQVVHGVPFGQTYGLSHNWMKFIELAGPDTPALKVDERTADLHYQVGPPYIATAPDMIAIVRRWAELVPKVYSMKPELMSEMYAYCLAAADRGLPHEVVDSMMISAVDAYGEGWDMIDAIPDEEVCLAGITPNQSPHPLPTVLHYCQGYGVGDILFSKYLMPSDIFTCQNPLLMEPDPAKAMLPESAYKLNYRNDKKEDLKPKLHKRNVFTTCAMTSIVNEASLFFKLHHCKESEANKERQVDLLGIH